MMEELELLQKLKTFDLSAFNYLVSAYQVKVLNACYRFLLDRQDAEDISQEVFIEVYQSIQNFRGDSKLSTWIYRITVTKCLDELKKRKRKKRITTLGKLLQLDEISHWIAGGVPADHIVKQKEQDSAIQMALNKLPDNQRVAFTLSKIDGFANAEIAEIMNNTNQAVESLIHRAKKKVSEELKQILENKN